MFTYEQIRDSIGLFLIHEQFKLKQLTQSFTQEYKNQLQEQDPVFHEDMRKEYLNLIKTIIAVEVGRHFSFDTLEILGILEDINLEEYLK